MSTLAINGGSPAVTDVPEALFHWPIVTGEDESAVLGVLRAGTMSQTDITRQFEAEYAAWNGRRFALGTCNGTAALQAAFWACEIGAGDEIICPSITYWASATAAVLLGATVNFADIDSQTLCIDPDDIEKRIGPRTKAIVVVHYCGYPCDMDRILPLASRYGLRVIEDVSHAHGGLYKGKMVGTFGDIAAMSLMAGKSLAVGEAGMMVTDDHDLYQRAVCFGHYERNSWGSRYATPEQQITDPDLQRFSGAPIGGCKHRMNQTCAAMGRVQLRHYPRRMAEIQAAMNRFWDLLDDVPGIHAHRVPATSGSTMGGWYYARGLYRANELGDLPAADFAAAVTAEGVPCAAGCNPPLHTHPFFHDLDYFRQGRPTAVAFGQRDVRQGPGSLPVAERVAGFVIGVPWFKRDLRRAIEAHARAYRKVAEHAGEIPRSED